MTKLTGVTRSIGGLQPIKRLTFNKRFSFDRRSLVDKRYIDLCLFMLFMVHTYALITAEACIEFSDISAYQDTIDFHC